MFKILLAVLATMGLSAGAAFAEEHGQAGADAGAKMEEGKAHGHDAAAGEGHKAEDGKMMKKGKHKGQAMKGKMMKGKKQGHDEHPEGEHGHGDAGHTH